MGGTGMPAQVGSLLKRQVQLNALSYFLILALLTSTGLLVYLVTSSDAMPITWLLSDDWVRWLTTALLLAVVLYLALGHSRMRTSLLEVTDALQASEHEYEMACERLVFAHTAAEILVGDQGGLAIDALLDEIVGHFDADAAAVVGAEVTLVTGVGIEHDEAYDAVLDTAIEAVRKGEPTATCTDEHDCSTLAVPLRINGKLRDVLVVWRRTGDLPANQLEGLQLVARTVELALENRELFNEQQAKLEGMLDALVEISDRRYPGYADHASHVSGLADAIAQRMQFSLGERADLRMAALLHDVGMLELPEGSRGPGSDGPLGCMEHPNLGANLAATARLGDGVEKAIQSHHESVDGSGYPRHLSGEEIPVAAKILAVCEAYSGMVAPASPDHVSSPEQAMMLLRMGAGRLYDHRVVYELQRVLGVASVLRPEAAKAASEGILTTVAINQL